MQQWANDEGLVFLGVVALENRVPYQKFVQWLKAGRHAAMRYLEENALCREEPARLLPCATTAVVLALPYDQGDTLPADSPRIAQYARFRDYHRELAERGERVARKIVAVWGGNTRVTVDTAPLLEKALAEKSQLGFQGKNTLYIHPEFGSFLLLAEILCTAELPEDKKIPIDPTEHTPLGGCGKCDRCQVSCPTGALGESYVLDANLCLAYWTIEHRGPIPEKFWPHLGEYYFGCDLCQLVCPYNKPRPRAELPSSLQPRTFPSLFETAIMSQAQYEKYFGGTPLTRAKRNGLRRNALIAMTVTDDPRLPQAMTLAALDPGSPVGETLDQIRRYVSFPIPGRSTMIRSSTETL